MFNVAVSRRYLKLKGGANALIIAGVKLRGAERSRTPLTRISSDPDIEPFEPSARMVYLVAT